jgi:hypothetical protein
MKQIANKFVIHNKNEVHGRVVWVLLLCVKDHNIQRIYGDNKVPNMTRFIQPIDTVISRSVVHTAIGH